MVDAPVITLRPETAADIEPIRALIATAFTSAPHASGTEPAIVDALRACGELTLSIVAERAQRIVGHVAVSPVQLSTDAPGWYGLGPVAVASEHQRTGVGTALVTRVLEMLGERISAAGCVVLGDPAYYGRFGFHSGTGLTYDGAPAEYFQSLTVDARGAPNAAVSFSPAFNT